MKKQTVKFYRRGYFKTNKHTCTQCTTEGHRAYKYKVTVEASPVLDNSGFLIDHNEVHKLVTKYVRQNPMLSCEMTLINITHKVVKMLTNHGCALQKVGMEIRPVDHRLIDKVDGELKLIHNNGIEPELPASAEYWVEF
jgi:hypothetical protein